MANSTEVYLKKSGENNLRERKEGSIRTGRRGGRWGELTAPPLPTAMGRGEDQSWRSLGGNLTPPWGRMTWGYTSRWGGVWGLNLTPPWGGEDDLGLDPTSPWGGGAGGGWGGPHPSLQA